MKQTKKSTNNQKPLPQKPARPDFNSCNRCIGCINDDPGICRICARTYFDRYRGLGE